MSIRVGLFVLAALLAGFYVLFAIATRPPEAPAHQVFFNGTVLTLDEDNTVAEAMSVRGDRIEALGSSEEILARVGDDTEVTDLRGRTVMPGFVDAHGHFPASGQVVFSADLNSPPIGEITSIPAIVERLQQQAQMRADGWITGWGYDDTELLEGRHPTREDLDKVSSTRPVAIVHISAHFAVLNSVALAELEIGTETPDPEGGLIVRRNREGSFGEPNGVLEETAARYAMAKIYDIGFTDLLRMVTHASRDYLSHGVTTASAGGMPRKLAEVLGPLSQFNVFPQRVALFPLLEEIEAELLFGGVKLSDYARGRVSVPRVKLIADGSIQGYTAYLTKPYQTSFKDDDDWRGYPSLSREQLHAQVAALFERRIQVAIHANGDAAIEDALDAIAQAQQNHPWPEARPLLIHAQTAREDQIQRMAELSVTPSFFSAHAYYWGDRHRDMFLGPARARLINPAQWALQHDVRFSSHLDTPVTPIDPMLAVWAQSERRTRDGKVLGESQRINRLAALRAVTIDAAWQVFMDDEIGSLEVGKQADLQILSDNPLVAPDVRDIAIERVVIAGADVYRRR